MYDIAEHRRCAHEDRVETIHAIRQRAGVPYEVERVVCRSCGRVLDERPIRRAAA